MNIELFDKTTKFSCEVKSNNQIIGKFKHNNLHKFDIPILPSHLQIYIEPFKIVPIVRINKIAVNYGLAKIVPWDHMLEMTLEKDFFKKYFDEIIDAKKNYLDISKKEMLTKLGLDDKHNLVNKIKKELV